MAIDSSSLCGAFATADIQAFASCSSNSQMIRFTTIDPQRAIGYLQIDCACQRFGVSDKCKPNYGGCLEGKRSVPIELLDVAGLVPGAHQGRGLGNKFLDDLRQADALIHVVDVSGTTDAEGSAPRIQMAARDLYPSTRLC